MGIRYTIFEVKSGWIAVVSGEKGLKHVVSPVKRKEDARRLIAHHCPRAAEDSSCLESVVHALSRYFAGERVSFDFELDWRSYSRFAKEVWAASLAIPYGCVSTYGGLAERVGRPRAARAVGSALGMNPLPIIVPCHRVIKGDKTLGGYSAVGGPRLKEKLLRLEGVRFDGQGKVIS
jgi:methylated-DNA-[protein]-cysteine S-methyltransferase